ncbi:hypothetical protein [Enterovirga rhinocerotis]|uniref:Uncharacterized protein n=1 Tax=Enterovirga rhinocerotis TaxID=1339210 RepID=A0A4R7CBN0_9HYPH|nr:hypothetical protein [Enterovirga rhinocerotis]TDR94167.1 hypothetical protein EV668_1444 [Enterovirga rhinocerotis]
MTRTPRILRARWRFVDHLRTEAGGSITVHVSETDPRLERRRIRPTGHARPLDVFWWAGEPCFSPSEAASRAAIAAASRSPRPRQLELTL